MRLPIVPSLIALLVCGVITLPAPSAAQQVKLTYMYPEAGKPKLDATRKSIEDFEAAHPNVKVELIQSSWANLGRDLAARMAAGQTPDVVMAPEGLIWDLMAERPGAALPVGDIVEPLKAQLAPLILRAAFLDGRYYQVPYHTGPTLLYYRKDLFDAAGLKPPETWDELLRAAKALTKPPERYGYAPAGAKEWMTEYELHSYMLAAGARVRDEKGNVVLDSPETREALRFFVALHGPDVSPPGSKNYKYADAQTAFINGNAAMVYTFGHMLRRVVEQNPSIAALVRAIAIPRRSPSLPRGSSGSINSVWISGTTKHPTEAKDFVRFLWTKGPYQRNLLAFPGGNLPTLRSAMDRDYLDNPVLQQFPQAVAALFDEAKYIYKPGAEGGNYRGAGIIEQNVLLAEMAQRVMIDRLSVDEAVKETDAKIRQIYGKPLK